VPQVSGSHLGLLSLLVFSHRGLFPFLPTLSLRFLRALCVEINPAPSALACLVFVAAGLCRDRDLARIRAQQPIPDATYSPVPA
jgi:hypothetical protein